MFVILAATLASHIAAASPTANGVKQMLRTKDQALLDAITDGNRALWDRNLAPGAIYVDENGVIIGRADFLKQLTPLPKGTSGRLALIDYSATVSGDVATVIHREDEFENYHGQHLHAQYLTTETWLERGGEWKLALAHVYVVAKDPPAVALPAATLDSYAGHYRAAVDVKYELHRDGDRLVGGVSGGKMHPVLAEATDVLFVPGRPRQRFIIKRDAMGHVNGFVQRQEGEDVLFFRSH